MSKRISESLIVLCVLIIVLGCALELTQAWLYALPLTFSGAAGLFAALLWRFRPLRRATLLGFLIPAGVPFAFGVYVMAHELAYFASLRPGEGACGMGMLMAWSMILIIAPVCGGIGATIVAIASAVDRAVVNHKHPSTPRTP